MEYNFNFYMTYQLVKRGFTNIEEVPTSELLDVLENFLLTALNKQKKGQDLKELFRIYAEMMMDKEKNLAMIIHYLLGYISILQGFEVVWYINETEKPYFSYNKYNPDKIDGLNTKKIFDYKEVFELVLEEALDIKEQREKGMIRR